MERGREQAYLFCKDDGDAAKPSAGTGRARREPKLLKKQSKMPLLPHPPLITSTIAKFIPMFSLGLYFFQARHVTVNSYGCSRNKSCGHTGITMK